MPWHPCRPGTGGASAKYYNGYSAREIAGFLSATPDAVTQTLHRARKKLAEILDERGETP